MSQDNNENQTPEKPIIPQFPTDRIELNDPPPAALPPIPPSFPEDRIEKGEVPDIKPE